MKKLTAVSIIGNGKKVVRFMMLDVDVYHRATLPQSILNKLLDELGVRVGDTFTVG
jgi:hypothetical protein